MVPDLLAGELSAIQKDGHLPGALTELQCDSFRFHTDKERILFRRDTLYIRKLEYFIASKSFGSFREHAKPEYGFSLEGNHNLCCFPAEGRGFERAACLRRLIAEDAVQKILLSVAVVVAISLLHQERISIHFRVISPNSIVLNLNHHGYLQLYCFLLTTFYSVCNFCSITCGSQIIVFVLFALFIFFVLFVFVHFVSILL